MGQSSLFMTHGGILPMVNEAMAAYGGSYVRVNSGVAVMVVSARAALLTNCRTTAELGYSR